MDLILQCILIIFSVIKQIYHVWEGYLPKIPVLRLNFLRLSAGEILRLSTGIFSANTPPKHYISVHLFFIYIFYFDLFC
jgi:hypothetical membrane protein